MRLRHIARILIKNGLGFIIEQVGLNRLLAVGRDTTVPNGARTTRSVPERLRLTLEELGPTYVKVGQLLSTRPDILPPAYIAELSKLLDRVPPFPSDAATEIVEAELEKPLDELFVYFDPQPIASASIGQVHNAILPSGAKVVVKVQRPRIRQTIETDMGLLLRQARFLEKRSTLLRDYQISDLFEEFSLALQDELDYIREGRNADRLRQVLSDDPVVNIPKIYWELTTSRVITLEDVQGLPLTDLETIEEANYDLEAVADVIADIYFRQVFEAGIFHADPHPANIILHDNQVSLVDFGLVGFLGDELKDRLRDLFTALLSQNVERITDIVLDLGAIRRPPDRRMLEKDVRRLLHRYYGVALESVSIGDFLKEITSTAFKHHIRLPADLALLARTMIVLEGITLRLNPEFNSVEFAKPYVRRVIRARFNLRRWGEETLRTLRDLSRLLSDLPQRTTVLLDQLEDGELTVQLDLKPLDRIMRKIDTLVNRLSFSVIIAALIIGSSLIIQAGQETTLWNLPILGWGIPVPQIIFLAAGILSGWWLFSIIRSRGL
jgi:ubiquinone biosynthesis protein